MIEYIKGELVEQTPTSVVIETMGVGYMVNVSLITYTDLQNKTNVKLYIHEVIREDAHILFGFSTKKERELFLLLISVSGVGAATARIILSSYSVDELMNIISSEDARALNLVKGIGTKSAQRIIVDLKDKITTLGDISTSKSSAIAGSATSETKTEAVSALVMLGYTAAAAQKAVDKVLKAEPDLDVAQVIKKSFKNL